MNRLFKKAIYARKRIAALRRMLARPRLYRLTQNPVAMPVAYLAGLSLSLVDPSWTLAAAAASVAAIAFLMAFASGRGGALLVAAFLALGLVIGAARLELLGTSLLRDQYLGKRVTAEATVTAAPRLQGTGESIPVHAESIELSGETVKADEDALVEIACRDGCPQAPPAGSRIAVKGSVKEPSSVPGADFDYGLYLKRRGINAEIAAGPGSLKQLPSRRGGWSALVDAARRHALSSLETGDWGPAGAVLKGMVIGDTEQVPDEVISDFQAAGLLHMLAVSGENVVLLGIIVSLFCRALWMPRLPATLISMLVIGVYVPLTGGGPSIVRAGVVGILGLAALLFSRQGDRYHFLALAAAVILSLNPYSLLDPGFQLSFAAVLAIFFIAPIFQAPLRRLPGILREAIAISAAAGLATAPITLVHFHQVSLVTVPANVAAESMAGPVMLLGVLSILANLISSDLCWLLNALAAACTGYVISAAHFFASLPGAVYNGGSPSIAATIAYYGGLGAAVLAIRRGALSKAGAWLKRRRLRLAALALVVATAAGFACFGGGTEGHSPSRYTVSFLDVGQGDAELFQVPGGTTVLIDGGPGSAVLDRLSESGVTRLDAVILTHPHADHLAGLIEVLKKFPVAAVYDGGPQTSSPLYRDFLKEIDKDHIPYRVVRRGQTLSFGELTLKVYNPGDEQRPDDPNADSVVVVAAYRGLDILCSGDAEGDVLGTLDLPRVDVYKVGHHGSRDSQLTELLTRIQPQMAVISVGENNDYGHPAADTVAKLKQAGARIFRTDRQGTIRVSITDNGIEVNAEK